MTPSELTGRTLLQTVLGASLVLTPLWVTVPAMATVVLTNGGFETTVGSNLGSGLYLASGWTDETGLATQAVSAPAGFAGTSVAGVTGSRFLRLASDPPDPQSTGIIAQDMGTMVAGTNYTITGTVFGGNGNQLWGVIMRLGSDGTATPATLYASQSLIGYGSGSVGIGALDASFTATSANSGLQLFLSLQALPSGVGRTTRGGVDNLQLVTTASIPEPASVLTLASSLAGLLIASLLRRPRLNSAAR
jgi:hypothetical protein